MASMTYYVALAFMRSEGGGVVVASRKRRDTSRRLTTVCNHRFKAFQQISIELVA